MNESKTDIWPYVAGFGIAVLIITIIVKWQTQKVVQLQRQQAIQTDSASQAQKSVQAQ